MLNVRLDPIYIERVHTTVKNQIIRKATKKKATSPDAMLEADTVFVYIARYTEGGAPYGLTWEEQSALIMIPSTPLTFRSDHAQSMSPKNLYRDRKFRVRPWISRLACWPGRTGHDDSRT